MIHSGWVPKPVIRGLSHKIFILDFFGSPKLRGGLDVPPNRILTAFGSPWNTFLGYYLDNKDSELRRNNDPKDLPVRREQGIIWGKDRNHFEGKENMLAAVASKVPLIATTGQVFRHPNIQWLGHQNKQGWSDLLFNSKFLLGLGNPLLGPSAIDAIAHGCVYINPIYTQPMRDGQFRSQHPFAQEKIGMPYVCSFHEDSQDELLQCVSHALSSNLKPFIPSEFSWDNYLARVEKIFLS